MFVMNVLKIVISLLSPIPWHLLQQGYGVTAELEPMNTSGFAVWHFLQGGRVFIVPSETSS